MKATPDYYPEFLAKRCNFPISDPQMAVAEWEDILHCTQEPLFVTGIGSPCVGGLDYTKTNDFCECSLTFRNGADYYSIHHGFICRNSRDLPNIHAPVMEWAKYGWCEIVDDVEINPDLPVQWFASMAQKYNIMMIGIDNYRYSWLNSAFKKILGFDAFDKEDKRIYLVRPSDIAKAAPIINSALLNHKVSGWDRMMCWYCNNTKKILDTKGNVYYGKIEPALRKTDGFMAWVHSMCCIDFLPETVAFPDIMIGAYVF